MADDRPNRGGEVPRLTVMEVHPMSRPASGVALRLVRRLFTEGSVVGLSDAQLLSRFADDRDEGAFAALVDRHGPMVLSVCRSLVRDPADAEDAFQATFLILARRTGGFRLRGDSIGGWLHRVAYRAAVRAAAEASRRRSIERQAAEAAAQRASESGRAEALREAVHREVGRLPERYRVPVVLCHLEGRTHAQAAAELHWGEKTVRRRLADARELLRSRLTREGIAPTAGLLALLRPDRASSAVAAARSAAVVRQAIAATSGGAFAALSGRLVALAAIGRARAAAGLAVAALAVVCPFHRVSATGEGAPNLEPPPPSPTASVTSPAPAPLADRPTPRDAAPDDAPTAPIEVLGRVVDPDGAPVAGATITAARFRDAGVGPFGWERDRQELAHVRSGPDGRFAMTFDGPDPGSSESRYSPDHWRGYRIVASSGGFGPAWASVNGMASGTPLELQLARDDSPINGRLVDLEGRPIAGATIRIHKLWKAESAAAIDDWIERVSEPYPAEDDRPRSHYFPLAGAGLPNSSPALPGLVATDADGRFRVDGLGRDRLAILEIAGPSIATGRVQVVTRSMGAVEGRRLDEPLVGGPTYHGAEATVVAQPGRLIAGIVRDAETGAPIPGAIVTAHRLGGSLRSIEGIFTAETDASGRYRLLGLPKGDGHVLAVYPPLDRPYFITDGFEVPDAPGIEPARFDMELRAGRWIDGRVTDARTGASSRAVIHYYPYLANDRAQDYPNFDTNRLSANWTGDRCRTDAEGRYRVVGLPGPGVVTAKGFDRSYRLGAGAEEITAIEGPQSMRLQEGTLPTYNQIHPDDFHAVAEVDPPADAESFSLDLTLDPGQTLTVRLEDPDGAPLTGVRVASRFPDAWGYDEPLEGNRVTLLGLDPARPRPIAFQHPDLGLGGVLMGGGEGDDGDRTLTLRPCPTITGRLVDAEGRPVAGDVHVELLRGIGGRYDTIRFGETPTGEDGRFRIDDLPPGGPYVLYAQAPDSGGVSMKPTAFRGFPLALELDAAPGATIDLGTFDVSTGAAADPSPGSAMEDEQRDPPPPADPPAASENSAPDDASSVRIDVVGRVIGPDGSPVAGASVRATEGDESIHVETDADGRFRLPVAEEVPRYGVGLVATRDGYAPGFVRAEGGATPEDAIIRLKEDDPPIVGRVLNLEGRPVAGATVRPIWVREPEGGDLSAWLEAARSGNAGAYELENGLLGNRIKAEDVGLPTELTTDAEGRFRLDGIGQERLVELQIVGPTIRLAKPRVMTRPEEGFDLNAGAGSTGWGVITYRGATFDLHAAPSRPIVGVVRDLDSGEVLPGVTVRSEKFAEYATYGQGDLSTTTDSEGRFRLDGMPPGTGNKIVAEPPIDLPYFGSLIAVEDAAGLGPVELEVGLKRGIWIEGRVTDAETGEPVRRGIVRYGVYRDNPHFEECPELEGSQRWGAYRVGEDGGYRIPGLPGRGVICVLHSRSGRYLMESDRRGLDAGSFEFVEVAPQSFTYQEFNAVVDVDIPEDDRTARCDVTLSPSQTLTGSLSGPDGEPLSGVRFDVADRFDSFGEPLDEPSYRLEAMPKTGRRVVLFRHEQEELAAVAVVDLERGAAPDVRLEPWGIATGRLVDEDGRPRSGVRLYIDGRLNGEEIGSITGDRYGERPITGDDGRFRVEGLISGLDHEISAMVNSGAIGKAIAKGIEVEAGETRDLGDVREEE